MNLFVRLLSFSIVAVLFVRCASDFTPPAATGRSTSTCGPTDASTTTFSDCAAHVFTLNLNVKKAIAQSDDKLLIAGNENNAGTLTYTLARFTSGGKNDTDFHSNGILRTDLALGRGVAKYEDTTSRFYAVLGATVSGSTKTWFIEKYGTDGAQDTAFGSSGKVALASIIGAPKSFDPTGIAVNGDGTIYVVGTVAESGFVDKIGVASVDATGASPSSIVTDLTPGTTTENVTARAVLIDNAKRVIAIGNTCVSPGFDPACPVVGIRIDSTLATVDSTFRINSGFPTFRDAFVQASDSAIVLLVANGTANAVTRYSSTGTLDTTFGSSSSGILSDNSDAVVANGALFLVFSKNATSGSKLTRYSSMGAIDTTVSATSSRFVPAAAVLQAGTGKIIVFSDSAGSGTKAVNFEQVTPP